MVHKKKWGGYMTLRCFHGSYKTRTVKLMQQHADHASRENNLCFLHWTEKSILYLVPSSCNLRVVGSVEQFRVLITSCCSCVYLTWGSFTPLSVWQIGLLKRGYLTRWAEIRKPMIHDYAHLLNSPIYSSIYTIPIPPLLLGVFTTVPDSPRWDI